MKNILFLTVWAMAGFTAAITGFEELPKGMQKKLNKEFTVLFPGQMVEKSKMELSAAVQARKKALKIDHLYFLTVAGEPAGVLVLARANSKFDEFDYAVIYDNEMRILSVKILAYREDHGGEIGSKRWLRQFAGKGTGDPIALYEDIQGISGATISCKSAVEGVHDITGFLTENLKK